MNLRQAGDSTDDLTVEVTEANSGPSGFACLDISLNGVGNGLDAIGSEPRASRKFHDFALGRPEPASAVESGNDDFLLESKVINSSGVHVDENTPEDERDRLYVLSSFNERRLWPIG